MPRPKLNKPAHNPGGFSESPQIPETPLLTISEKVKLPKKVKSHIKFFDPKSFLPTDHASCDTCLKELRQDNYEIGIFKNGNMLWACKECKPCIVKFDQQYMK